MIARRLVDGALARPEVVVLAVAACGYALLAAPGVAWMDAGELTAAAHTLGVAHPPGHPLHSLAGKAAALVPLGEIAWRVALLSSLTMAAALAGVVALGRALVGDRPAALWGGAVAALVVGLAPAAQLNAARAEVYGPTAALLVWSAVFATRAVRGGEGAGALRAALLAALAAALHPPSAAAVALPLAIALLARLGRRAVRLAPWGLALGALALATYAYLPLRAAAPGAPLLVWGEPSSWDAFVAHVGGAAYQGNFALDGAGARAGGALALLLEGPALGVALAGLVGLALAALTGLRGAGPLLAIAPVVIVEVALQRAFNPDLRGYLLPALLVLAAGVAPLVEAIRRLAGEIGAGGRGAAAVAGVVTLPIALAAALAPAGPALDRGDDATRLHDETVARLPPGPGAYVASGDASLFAALYERLVAGARPDLALAHDELSRDRWFLAMVERMRPELATPYIDDGVRGQLIERLVVDNLRAGRVVGGDRPAVGALPARDAAPRGRAYAYALAPRDATPAEAAPPPLAFDGELGRRVARAVALTRAGYEAERGRLADAARAAGLEARFDGAALAALAGPPASRPPLLAHVPALSFAFVSEPWQAELIGDDLAWRAGLPPPALGADAAPERRVHAAWRALLERGAPGLADAEAALAPLGAPVERATAAMLAALAPPLAEPWLDRVLARRPDDVGALALRASLLANRGALPDAEAAFRRAIAAGADDAETWARLGVVLARQGRRAEADAAWRAALERDPSRRDVRAWLTSP